MNETRDPITDGTRLDGFPSPPDWRLPRRDFFLLPAIFVLTILVILGGGELVTRLLYAQDDAREPCEYTTPTGFRYHPMCTSRTKVWEGPWITQHFNDCGYRTAESCAPRPAGALRVVVMGSSTARGALVNYQDSFAARASAVLSRQCGGLVDFQNLGTEPWDFSRVDQRVPEALALHPAAIVMTVGPFDLVHVEDRQPIPGEKAARPKFNLGGAVALLRQSRLFLLMQYYLYRDPAFQVHGFLMNGDQADYVRAPLSPAWQGRVSDLDQVLQRITAQTKSVPVLLFYVPERAQVALAKSKANPPGVNPFVLQTAVAQTAARNGIQFFDTTKSFADEYDFQSLFYLTDGHPRDGGHAAIARVVQQALAAEPAFASCAAE